MFDIDGNVLDGDFPKNKIKYVQTWAEIHRDELIANWQIAQERGELYKIEPLR